MRLPMKVYQLANSGDKAAMEFKKMYGDQPGQYQDGMWEQFKQQYESGDVSANTQYEEDLDMSPEEMKATDVIEGYGDKYRTEMDLASEKNAEDLQFERDQEHLYNEEDEQLAKLQKQGYESPEEVPWWERDDNSYEDDLEDAEAHSNDNIHNYLEWEGIIGYDEDIDEIMSPDAGGTFEQRKENLDNFLEEEGIIGYTDKIADFYRDSNEEDIGALYNEYVKNPAIADTWGPDTKGKVMEYARVADEVKNDIEKNKQESSNSELDNLFSELSSSYQEDAINDTLESIDEYDSKEQFMQDVADNYRNIIKHQTSAKDVYDGFKKYGDEGQVAEVAGRVWDLRKGNSNNKQQTNSELLKYDFSNIDTDDNTWNKFKDELSKNGIELRDAGDTLFLEGNVQKFRQVLKQIGYPLSNIKKPTKQDKEDFE